MTSDPAVKKEDALDALLDDVLDEFAAFESEAAKEKDQKKPPPQQQQQPQLQDPAFAADLEAGMEALLNNLLSTAHANPSDDKNDTSSVGDDDARPFQQRVQETLERLQNSAQNVDAEVEDVGEDALMAELMNKFAGMGDGTALDDLLADMMSELMAKDVLYDPLKELADKYPKWLEENKDKVPSVDYDRYTQQYQCCIEMLKVYDEETGTPSKDTKPNESTNKELMACMQRLQECGQPPADLIKLIAPDMPDIENVVNAASGSGDCPTM